MLIFNTKYQTIIKKIIIIVQFMNNSYTKNVYMNE
jgi:hypothetical protein